jgi:hypothetical protein
MNLLKIDLKVDKKVVQETLSRMGIANKKNKILYPSCYLYEKNGIFYIAHFKQLFSITRSEGYDNISEEDIIRRNAVVFCLKKWGLIDVVENITPCDRFIFVLPFNDRTNWIIKHKFNTRYL